ncbi:MAG: TonB-dependent receptor [Acidobacteriota bacterium]|nr:TonB-dependent receptor [Acidobacteriota bacterium]
MHRSFHRSSSLRQGIPSTPVLLGVAEMGAARIFSLLAALLLVLPGLLAAAPPPPPEVQLGAIEGRVLDEDGEPIPGIEVQLLDLRRTTLTGSDGIFRFDDVLPGDHLLEASSRESGSGVQRIEVAPGETASAELRLEISHFRDTVVVSASGDARSRLELAQATTILSGDELGQRLEPSLGETLAKEPGISSTSFGIAASRPVIRGLGGDRVSMLENGLGTGDVSSTSPDHAVSIEPLSAERIEVLRGPATLLYGSNAIGGAVNVISGRIPLYRNDQAIGGFVEMRGASAADERTGSVSLDGGSDDWAWHVDFQRRDTEDYEIPGFAESAALRAEEEHGDDDHEEDEHGEEEEAFGFVPNSDLTSTSGSVGFSHFFGDTAVIGFSVSGLDNEYGLPGGHGHGEEDDHGDDDHGDDDHGDDDHGDDDHGEEEEEGPVRLDLKSRRADFHAQITRPMGPFSGLKARAGVTDYEHVELEGDEIGTLFTNDSWEARVELVQKERGNLKGSLGVQLKARDLEAIGEEAFLPPSDTESQAIFTFQELTRGEMRYQFGLRYENQDVGVDVPGLPDRSFDGLSSSLGLVWQPSGQENNEGWALAASLGRSVKLPNSEELYSDGLHVATQSFELGDANLEEEVSLGLEVGLRKQSGRLTGELSVFVNRFDDFIFRRFTGEEEEGFPVVQYSQADAEFRGAELDLRYGLWESGTHHLDLELFGDYVRAERRDENRPLPSIPPLSFGTGLHYHSGPLTASVEVRRHEEQDRVSENETPTDGYTLLNASFGHRFLFGNQVVDVLLRGHNLTDEDARNHVSVLKDTVPLPGRDFSLALRFWF